MTRDKPPRNSRRTVHPDLPPPVEGKCNAKRSGVMKRCGKPAGWNTPYTEGPCKLHGGAHEHGRMRAAKLTYEKQFRGQPLFGEVVELAPELGLTVVAAKLHGFAAYMENVVSETADPETGHVQVVEAITTAGGGSRQVVDTRVKLWLDTLERAARVYKMAVDAKVSQLEMDLIASYQARVLDLMEATLRDLGHDPDDPGVVEIVARRLALVAGTVGRTEATP